MKLYLVLILTFFSTAIFLGSPFDAFLAKRDSDKAMQMLKNEDYDGAINSYYKAISRQTNSALHYYNLASAFALKGDKERATETFDIAKEMFNKNTSKSLKNSVHYNAGILASDLENYSLAVNELVDALSFDPKDDDARTALEYARKRLKEEQQKEQDKNEDGDSGSDDDKSSKKDTGKETEDGLEQDYIDRLLESLRQNRKDDESKEQFYGGGSIDKDW